VIGRLFSSLARFFTVGRRVVVVGGPIVLAFTVVGGIFLYGHAPHDFAANYSPPRQFALAYERSEYAAMPLPNGGWDLFDADSHGRVAFQRVNAQGRTLIYEPVGYDSDATSQPAMAENGRFALAAWIVEHNGALTLRAAYVGTHRSAAFTLNPGGGLVEHPFVVSVPHDGFDVLFEWQHPGNFDIFLASIPTGVTHPAFIRRLVRSPDYGFYPRGVIDGSGALDVIYMELCCQGNVWLVKFQRFSPLGRALGKPITIDSITGLGQALPEQWGIDLKREPDGSIWAAWEGDGSIAVAHWSATGRMLERPHTILSGNLDTVAPAVALALVQNGGIVFYTYQDSLGAHLASVRFDAQGRQIAWERVAYDTGGQAANPRAGTVNGRVEVIWQKTPDTGLHEIIEGAQYRAARSPSLAAQFGLNIGDTWADVALIVLGALGGAVPLTVINVLILVPLILIWLPIERIVPVKVRWLVYLAIIAFVLAIIFAASSSAPGFVFIVPAFGWPYGWLAVAGACFVSYWVGRFIFGRQESIFRAAAMALVAFYFVAAMYVAVMIQGELGRI
jgi:hypothetical protein